MIVTIGLTKPEGIVAEKKTEESSRVDIIQAVKTPLGFFTLIVLVVEVVFGIVAAMSSGPDRSYLVIGMIVLIFLLVLIVSLLAVLKPGALVSKEMRVETVEKMSSGQKIEYYRRLIADETRNNLLDNFHVPDGYKAEISTLDGFPFGFCYPQEWDYIRFPQMIQYGGAADAKSAGQIGFQRNFNLILQDISNFEIKDLAGFYQEQGASNLALFPGAQMVEEDTDFVLQGLKAYRYRMDFLPNGATQRVSLYQVIVADSERKALYILSFSTTADNFDASRKQFENIINTLRL
jgi:hypothetical protein